MQLVGTQIHEERGAKPSYIVEFVGDGGEVISVQMQQSASGDLTRLPLRRCPIGEKHAAFVPEEGRVVLHMEMISLHAGSISKTAPEFH